MSVTEPVIGHGHRVAEPQFLPKGIQGDPGNGILLPIMNNWYSIAKFEVAGSLFGYCIYRLSIGHTHSQSQYMEKLAHNLAVETAVVDEELQQLMRRVRQIDRVLLSLRVTSRIMAFTIAYLPKYDTLLTN